VFHRVSEHILVDNYCSQ